MEPGLEWGCVRSRSDPMLAPGPPLSHEPNELGNSASLQNRVGGDGLRSHLMPPTHENRFASLHPILGLGKGGHMSLSISENRIC